MAREPTFKTAQLKGAAPEDWPLVYAGWRASRIGALTDRIERELILELLGDIADLDVLDVGCGDGDLSVTLWKRHAQVSGIDASQAMIDAARTRARGQNADIAFTRARAEQLPFPDSEFDVVVAVTILCFTEDAAGIFREMARVLRPGGRLVIGELGKWSTWAAARRIRGWLGSPTWRKARFRTAPELSALAGEAGLTVEVMRGAIYYPRLITFARFMAPLDEWIGWRTTMGAAFLALRAVKPESPAFDVSSARAEISPHSHPLPVREVLHVGLELRPASAGMITVTEVAASALQVQVIAVGTRIATCPPHKTERAPFGHSASTLGA